MKRKRILFSILAVVVLLIIICIFLYVHIVKMCIKADNLSHLSNWEHSITYTMLSDKLKAVISEEEFNDRTQNGKYNMYVKLQNLELEPTDDNNPSTGWFKTPPCDYVKINNGGYSIEYRIDFEVHFNRIEVINFVTYISEVKQANTFD